MHGNLFNLKKLCDLNLSFYFRNSFDNLNQDLKYEMDGTDLLIRWAIDYQRINLRFKKFVKVHQRDEVN